MARVLIYDSDATEDSSGVAFADPMTLEENTWRTSYPMRAHGGPKGDQRNISYEFVLSGNPIGEAISFQWYQRFFNDHPWTIVGQTLPSGFRQWPGGGVGIPASPSPHNRVFPGSASDFVWAREQVAVAGAFGVIDHYNVTRNVANMTVPIADGSDCRYFPMLVHTLWVAISIRTTTAEPAAGYPRFRVYAHGGGLTDIEAYSERLDKVFSWDVPYSE